MIAIIDYDAGNLTSVARAVNHLGYECKITNVIRDLESSERIIFPGVGAAGSAMISLKRLGLDGAIRDAYNSGKPLLGICLGTQIIMGHSKENDTVCLGLIDGEVDHFPPRLIDNEQRPLKIPQMGWNAVKVNIDHPLLSDVRDDDEFYFVHSYYPVPKNPSHVIATTDYGISFASVVGHANLVATQFHLEKSGKPGLKILKKFCEWNPC